MQRIYKPIVPIAIHCLLATATPSFANAACSIQITSVSTCDSKGDSYSPKVGDCYYLRAYWSVTGTPTSTYNVTFIIANQTWTMTNLPASGGNYWGYFGNVMPLDGPIPCTVVVDPANATGAPSCGRTATYTLTPVPPTSAVDYFNPLTYTANQTFTVNWNDGSGGVSSAVTLLGCPTSDSYERVLSETPPPAAKQVTSTPGGDPVFETDYRNYSPVAGNDTWRTSNSFTVALSAVRVNPILLRHVTWSALAAAAPSMQPCLRPDTLVQSSDPTIVQFVQNVLPANYQVTMTPYDAARALFLAVVGRTTYVSPPPCGDAAHVLAIQQADCGGFSTLTNACLRAIGIPSRCIMGFWQGTNVYHCIVEAYFPGCGWFPIDGSSAKSWDPTGTYSYCFGADPNLNSLCVVTRGTSHVTSDATATAIQVGWWQYRGNATSSKCVTNSTLTPASAVPTYSAGLTFFSSP